MATVDIDLLINTAGGANSIKDIRTQMKALKDAMISVGAESDEFTKLAVAAEDLKGRMDDVNERIAAVDPDGFKSLTSFAGKAAGAVSAVTGAMALFGDQSEDVQKALLKVQSALALSQGIDSIKGLRKEFMNLWKDMMKNPIASITALLAGLAIAAYAVYTNMMLTSDATKQANIEYEKQKELTAAVVREKQREVDLLVAQGASEAEIMEAKKESINAQILELELSVKRHKAKIQDIRDNDSLWESIIKMTQATQEFLGNEKAAENARVVLAANKRERAEEEIKQLKEDEQAILDLRNNLAVMDAERETKAREQSKTTSAEKAKNEQDYTDALLKEIEERRKAEESAADAREQLEYERWLANKQRQEQDAKDHRAYVEAKHAKEQEAHEARKKQIEQQQKLEEMVMKARLDAVAGLFGSLAQLAGKNAKLQKAFSVAEATINTYKGVTNALAQPLPVPINLINAAAILAAGIANVRKILAVEPNAAGGGATSGGGIASGASGAAAIGAAPAQPSAPTTQLDENGNVVGQSNQQEQNQVRVFVVESDIRSTGQRVQVAEAAATFR